MILILYSVLIISLTCPFSPSANSTPKGPVYVSARREVLEEELDDTTATANIDLNKWPPIAPIALSPAGNTVSSQKG